MRKVIYRREVASLSGRDDFYTYRSDDTNGSRLILDAFLFLSAFVAAANREEACILNVSGGCQTPHVRGPDVAPLAAPVGKERCNPSCGLCPAGQGLHQAPLFAPGPSLRSPSPKEKGPRCGPT